MVTGKPVESLITWSSSPNKDPPPVKTIPLSTISAANSGSEFSSVFLTASIIA